MFKYTIYVTIYAVSYQLQGRHHVCVYCTLQSWVSELDGAQQHWRYAVWPLTLALIHFFLVSCICAIQMFNSNQGFNKMLMVSDKSNLAYSDLDAFKHLHEIQSWITPWNYTSHENVKYCAYNIQLMERQEEYCSSTQSFT